MVSPKKVTACLVTRGDQPDMMTRILDSLIFDDIVIWDNSRQPDKKTAGRYHAIKVGANDQVYFQDDDVIVPPETQRALVAAYEPGMMTAVYGHGQTPAGYDDLPLVCGGGIVDRDMPWQAIGRYAEHHQLDESFDYYCDFAVGVLYPMFKHIRLRFDIELDVAQHPSRLCNQPFARQMKADVTARARAIRDAA